MFDKETYWKNRNATPKRRGQGPKPWKNGIVLRDFEPKPVGAKAIRKNTKRARKAALNV